MCTGAVQTDVITAAVNVTMLYVSSINAFVSVVVVCEVNTINLYISQIALVT